MEQSEILQYLAELTGIEGHAFHRAILLEVVVWFVMIAAVIIDFSTGIRKARVLKIPRLSLIHPEGQPRVPAVVREIRRLRKSYRNVNAI